MHNTFSPTSPRTFVRKTEEKCVRCVKRHKLVEMRRIELLTPCLQGRCSPSWATPPDRILYVANFSFAKGALVGLSGLEPPTSRLSGVRSNRLSYRPMQGFFNGFLSSFPLLLFLNILLWMFNLSIVHSKTNSTFLVSTNISIRPTLGISSASFLFARRVF